MKVREQWWVISTIIVCECDVDVGVCECGIDVGDVFDVFH